LVSGIFYLIYLLGTTARYHCDSFCATSTEMRYTKPIVIKSDTTENALKSENAIAWLTRVRENFEFCWVDPGLAREVPIKDDPEWKGFLLEEVKTELFLLPYKENQRFTRFVVL
jgi:hypothetical protein